jgi:NAD(P)-dependent dehydrogenase (short-subunit alcohol dehydrogenase family)
MQDLAQRGAHIIALSPKPVEDPEINILIDVLRSTTKNEQIFADECDLTSASSVRSFCSRFLTEKETKLDAIVFAHEYQHLGSVIGRHDAAPLIKLLH